jgi:TRAP-type mannitol/chloroaromatic compound transport system permease large subunit
MILVGAHRHRMILTDPRILLSQLKNLAYSQFSIYDLSVLPMFVLMGNIASQAGLSRDLFRAANAWLGWLRGGVAMSAIAACAGFGAVCGSSLATASTMGQVALPELRRYRYGPELATGTLACGRRARHPHSALDRAGRLCHRRRGEHRRHVHRCVCARPDRGSPVSRSRSRST